jgi:hypothetical protein
MSERIEEIVEVSNASLVLEPLLLNGPCPGTCVYDLVNGQYVLNGGSSTCVGSATCKACPGTLSTKRLGLLLLLGDHGHRLPQTVPDSCPSPASEQQLLDVIDLVTQFLGL